ncbi:EAL and HDOD domain-containing protein [Comamonas sp. GB3 AK4-5]|uniref:EAL and HDOD domain-containing protein n=1 Tax=Comamonas sp. GB3 AK4-5 TaxID=3231487 RepID=UPI00351F5352
MPEPSHHTAPAPQPGDPRDASTAIIARQPIVNAQREVFGYELFDRSTPAHAHTAASDAALLVNALSYAGAKALVGHKTVFINCTLASLASGHLELIHPDKVVLEIPTLGDAATPEQVAAQLTTFAQLRARGFRLAFDQSLLRRSHVGWLPMAAFIKLDMRQVAAGQAEALVRFARQHTRADIVAEKVETQAQFEFMQALGVTLFQGFWFAQPDVVHTKTMRPGQTTVLQLIDLVRKQAEIGEIEALLKRDPTLSYHLLRFINSSGFGLSCEITSFRHAVVILGLKKLFRWAALLLTTASADCPVPAVGHTAVVRGRLMELLARELLPPEEAEHAFVVGVFSLLDSMLNLPMTQALESVSLPQPVRDALLHRSGVLAPFLALTLACEQGDDQGFAHSAHVLQLSNHQVNWAHLQALAWAEALAAAPESPKTK